MQWLEVDFLSYFKEWEDSLDEDDKEKFMIAQETRTGLNFTGIISHHLTKTLFLFKTHSKIYGWIGSLLFGYVEGVKCVLTEHLYQDPLEAFFVQQRMSCGRSDNPNVYITWYH